MSGNERAQRRSAARRTILSLGAVLVAAGAVAQTASPAAPPPPRGVPPASSIATPGAGAGRYVGAASCASSNCHGSVRPRQVFDVLQDEYFTWLRRDRHSQAYAALFDERSRVIGRNLGLDTEAAQAPLCLDCHALAPPAEVRGRGVELEDGVSCESCHGPAGGWLARHTEEGWSHADSVAAGMVDLAAPAGRAVVCLRCHLGAEGSRVDHRLLAAGHPRLAFELDNYSAGMPAHWRDRGAAEAVATWAVGQAVALERQAELLAAEARAGDWPQLAAMSCDDCHHSLDEELWRRPTARPLRGLPRLSPVRLAVFRHLVTAVAPEERPALDRAFGELDRAVARLGAPPAGAAEAADTLAATAARLRPRIEEAVWDEAAIRRLLLAVSGDGAALTAADQASAEQAYLAANTLTASLLELRPELAGSPLAAAIEGLGRALDDPFVYDRKRFADALERLDREARRLP